jgi:hypothetical protein
MFWTSSLETQTLLSLLRLHAKGSGVLSIHDIIIEAEIRVTGPQGLNPASLETIG